MGKVKTNGHSIYISPRAHFLGDAVIGHCSCIGFNDETNHSDIIVGESVDIGAFCILETDINIGKKVSIDHYCRISSGVTIGDRTKVLYGVQIFGRSQIGSNCIVGGDIAERTILEDEVTFMGEIAHSHRAPTNILTWDITDEPSPTIKYGSVIGVNALIIGGLTIGPQSYVAAGEIVRSDLPPRSVLYKGIITDLADWRGVIKVRGEQ